jgi:DNA-binding NarL/FixJ family response regulator
MGGAVGANGGVGAGSPGGGGVPGDGSGSGGSGGVPGADGIGGIGGSGNDGSGNDGLGSGSSGGGGSGGGVPGTGGPDVDGSGSGGSGVAVMVVDDHPLWRDAVARDLTEAGFRVVATAGDGDGAVRRARATRPRVMVLDLHLPGLSGAEVCRAAVADNPALRVLVLSASGEHADVLEAVRSGATGYLVKSAGRDELVAAVRRTAEGEPVFTPGLAGLVLGEFRRLATEAPAPAAERGRQPAPETPRLTERETEVLRLVAKGLTYRQIAERLVISHRTVQNHVQNTLGKLQLHNRVELVRYAIASGLDDPAAPGA